MASNGTKKRSTAVSISAQNTFSDPIQLYGDFVFEVSGLTDSTVTVQRRSDDTNWVDVTDSAGVAKAFTANGIYTGSEPARGVDYRWGIKTGDYGTDTVTGSLQQ